jgi:hypothetical protein
MSRPLLSILALAICIGPGCGNIQTRTVRLAPTVITPPVTLSDGFGHVAPRYLDGSLQGIRLQSVAPGSLAQHMGLQDGDVLLELAGLPCDHVSRCRAGTRRMESALMRRRPFNLLIERDGGQTLLRIKYEALRPLPM